MGPNVSVIWRFHCTAVLKCRFLNESYIFLTILLFNYLIASVPESSDTNLKVKLCSIPILVEQLFCMNL